MEVRGVDRDYFLDYVGKTGKWVRKGIVTYIPDEFINNKSFRYLLNNNKVELVDYGEDQFAFTKAFDGVLDQSDNTVQKALDKIDELSHAGQSYSLKFPFDTSLTSPVFLRSLASGDFVRVVVVDILNPFDSGFKISIGFPANNNEIIDKDLINLTQTGIYEIFAYRMSQINETLNLYYYGTSVSGNGIIYI